MSEIEEGLREKEPFVLMVKPVGSRCNMRCRYCYYLDKGKFSSHERQSRMSLDLLERVIREAISASPGDVVSFVWHGGEPALAGMEFYKKVVEYERKYLPKGWSAWNNLQTNGLLLNPKFCEFLAENSFDVGISIDGSEPVHDRNRRDLGGNPTYMRVMAAVKNLKAAGIEPDLLCTVNSGTVADAEGVFHALLELDCGWAQFIPIVVRTPQGTFSAESVTPEDYGDFLIEIFDLWRKEGLGRMDVQLFSEMTRVILGGEPALCTMAKTCGRALVAEEDGSIYSCDHFVDDEHRLGNLLGGKLLDFLQSPRQRDFGRSKSESLPETCKTCEYLQFCGGGCLKDRFGEGGRYYLCPGLKKFFSHAVPILKEMIANEKSR